MITELPNEILYYIYTFLNVKDIINCSLCCKKCNMIKDTPGLWSNFIIKSNKILQENPHFLYHNRFSLLKRIELNGNNNDELFEMVLSLNQIKQIKLIDFEHTTNKYLIKLLHNKEEVSFDNVKLTLHEKLCFLQSMRGTSIKCLTITGMTMFHIWGLKGQCNLVFIEHIIFIKTYLPPNFVDSFFTSICRAGEQCILKHLSIVQCSLIYRKCNAVARGVNSLASFSCIASNGHGIGLDRKEMIELILRYIVDKNQTNLTKLVIDNIRVNFIDSYIFSTALNEINEVDLSNSTFSKKQLSNLFIKMSTKTKIKTLSCHNIKLLCEIEPAILVNGLYQLENVNLDSTRLTIEQLKLFICENLKYSQIKVLNISNTNLNGIDENTFIGAINNMKCVVIKNTNFSTSKVVSFLSCLKNKTDCKLKHIVIHFPGGKFMFKICHPNVNTETFPLKIDF